MSDLEIRNNDKISGVTPANIDVVSQNTLNLVELRNRVCLDWDGWHKYIEDVEEPEALQELADKVNEKADALYKAFSDLIMERVKLKLKWDDYQI